MTLPLRNLASKFFAASHDVFEEARGGYAEAPGEPAFWMMTDLTSSASFRQASGEQAAFVRAFGFVQLCRVIARPYERVTIFKELGDAVLVRATNPRELFEFMVLLNLTGKYANVDAARDPDWPSLASRSAVTFGIAYQIDGDYLGQPLDRLARISSYKSGRVDCLSVLDESAREQLRGTVAEYPFAHLSDSFLVPAGLLKAGESAFRMSELRMDDRAASDFREFFAAARNERG